MPRVEKGFISGLSQDNSVKTERSKIDLRDHLSLNRPLMGIIQMGINPLLSEFADECGYDFVFLDREHGVFTEDDYVRSMKGPHASQSLTMVRIAEQNIDELQRGVNLGADCVVVPHVATVSEARTMAGAMYVSARARLIVIIESELGVANAREILSVQGVDGVLIGPTDLSADLGIPGEFGNPVYSQALANVERAASMAGKILGTVPHGDYSIPILQARGHRLLILGTDRSLVRDAMTSQIARARSHLQS